MSELIKKWGKAIYLTAAVAIIGLSAYGIYRTVSAYNAFNQPQMADCALAVPSSADGSGLAPCGLYRPYGCAGCSGCVDGQSQHSIEVVPGTAADIEQIS